MKEWVLKAVELNQYQLMHCFEALNLESYYLGFWYQFLNLPTKLSFNQFENQLQINYFIFNIINNSIFSFKFLKNGIQFITAVIICVKLFNMSFSFITNYFSDCLKIKTIFPNTLDTKKAFLICPSCINSRRILKYHY